MTDARVLLIAITSFTLAACGPAAAMDRLQSVAQARLSPTPSEGEDGAGATPDPAVQAAIQLVIYRSNFQQEQAIASRNSSLMQDTSTERYYREMVRVNQGLLEGGIVRIRLVALEWGPVSVTGDEATATTYETWTVTRADGSTAQSRDRNVYTLIRQNGAWKIQANEHPDQEYRPPPGLPQV